MTTPSFPSASRPARAAGRPEAPAARHTLARQGAGGRLVAGHAAGLHAGAVPLLGRWLRLACARGAAEPLRAVHDAHRRRRHPLHPRALQACRCAAAGDEPRLAGLDRRVPQGHRAADRPHRAWRRCGRCLPPGVPVAAGLWLLRQAHRSRLERGAHRARLERADAAAGLCEVRGAGRRLGFDGHHRHRPAGPRAVPGHPPDHADRRARPDDDVRSDAGREVGAGRAEASTAPKARPMRASRAHARRRWAMAWPIRPPARRPG